MKRNLFVISESERERILGMHKDATRKQYLSEQTQYIKDAAGKVSILQGPQVVPQGSTVITQQEYETALKTQQPPANQPVVAPATATPAPAAPNSNSTQGVGTTATSKFGVDYKYNYPGDKSYIYGYKDGKWYGKNVAKNVEFDLSTNPKWKSAIDNLNKQCASQIKALTPPPPNTDGSDETFDPPVQTTNTATASSDTIPSEAPVKYPWIGTDGRSSLTSLQKAKTSDPKFNNWKVELKKLSPQQLYKVKIDLSKFMEQISKSGIDVKSDQSYIVANQVIQDVQKSVGEQPTT